MNKYHPETLAVRAGTTRSQFNEHSDALFLTSSYVFDEAFVAKQVFNEERQGHSYSRFSNPTVSAFEERVSALEGAARSVATGTGMGATSGTLMALVKAGDHVICANDVFGSTYAFFANYLTKFGVEVSFVDAVDYAAWEASIKPNTKLVYFESPSNPLLRVVDIKRLVKIAKSATTTDDILVVADNCFATPILQRPIELGADIVVQSATKLMDGHGRSLGGVISCRNEEHAKLIHQFVRTAGLSLGAFDAWVFLKGLETLPVRVKTATANAQQLATFLSAQANVETVFYLGLETHPDYAVASQQMDGFGTILSFTVKGDEKEAWAVIDNTKLLSKTANVGDTRTTIVHPATTTHARIGEEQRQVLGITSSLIRVSVGLEHIDDICQDLANSLALLP